MARSQRASFPTQSARTANRFVGGGTGVDTLPALGLQRSLHDRYYAAPEPAVDMLPRGVRVAIPVVASAFIWIAIVSAVWLS